MLAVLLEDPRNPGDWNRWSFDHRDSHDRIRQAIMRVDGVQLTDYPVDPIDGDHIADFLQYNSQLHADMNGVLGLQSVDLLSVNFQDNNQREAWINLHYQEHFDAEQALGL
jgi:hypothetical protein